MARVDKTRDNAGKKDKTSPKFSQTEANLPLTDSVDWRQMIFRGSKAERIAAIGEAVRKKDADAVDILIEALDDEASEITDKCAEAISHIGVNAAQLENIIGMFSQGTNDETVIFALLLLVPKHNDKIGALAEKLVDSLNHQDVSIRCNAISILASLDHKPAIPLIREMVSDLEGGVREDAIKALGRMGDKEQIPFLKELLVGYHTGVRFDIYDEKDFTIEALKKLGVSEQEIDQELDRGYEDRARPPMPVQEPDEEYDLEKKPNTAAIYELLSKNRDVKRQVYENEETIELLPNKQAWLTINDPQLAKKVLDLAVEKVGGKSGGLDNALKFAFGIRYADFDESHYTFYADEILDTVSQVIRNSKLRDDPELRALLPEIKHGNGGVRLRYIRREKADISLGNKCGDCTARGSINFENSTSWVVNPAYQILKMSKDKRFIGRINFTLGNLSGEEAIIVDALEFNPQAQEGKPYHDDGGECLDAALGFLKSLARKEKRKLFALCVSNSSGAVEILQERGRPMRNVQDKNTIPLKLAIPEKRIVDVFYYQMLGVVVPDGTTWQNHQDGLDQCLPKLEREVLNPAQIADSKISEAMQERHFEKASSLILANPEYAAKVNELYGFPQNAEVSPQFLSIRIQKIYGADALDAESMGKTFSVNPSRFVRL